MRWTTYSSDGVACAENNYTSTFSKWVVPEQIRRFPTVYVENVT
jgi:hypothetical protein